MFVTNHSSLPSNTIWVTEPQKKYLESIGFCVLSYDGRNYAFTKSEDLLNKLSLWKGGKHG